MSEAREIRSTATLAYTQQVYNEGCLHTGTAVAGEPVDPAQISYEEEQKIGKYCSENASGLAFGYGQTTRVSDLLAFGWRANLLASGLSPDNNLRLAMKAGLQLELGTETVAGFFNLAWGLGIYDPGNLGPAYDFVSVELGLRASMFFAVAQVNRTIFSPEVFDTSAVVGIDLSRVWKIFEGTQGPRS